MSFLNPKDRKNEIRGSKEERLIEAVNRLTSTDEPHATFKSVEEWSKIPKATLARFFAF